MSHHNTLASSPVVNSGRPHNWIDWASTTKTNHMIY